MSDSHSKLHNRAEMFTAVLLAIATVATAWSSYQSTRWSGVQADGYSRASAARIESSEAHTRAGQEREVDVLTFTQWVDAYYEGDKELAAFYYARFTDEFKPAMRAWLATKPLKNPNAPPTPFVMPQYKVAEAEKAKRLSRQADAAAATARAANQYSDNYVLALVMFAAALFFAGVSTRLESPRLRFWVLGFGYVLFFATAIWILTFPVTISI